MSLIEFASCHELPSLFFGVQVFWFFFVLPTQFFSWGDIIILLGDFNANSASQMVKELLEGI